MLWFRKRPPQPLLKRRWRWSLRSSFLLHWLACSAVLGLIISSVPLPQAPGAKQIVLQAAPLAEWPLTPVEIDAFTPHTENWLADEAADIQHLEAAQVDPRWTMLTDATLDERPAEEHEAAHSFLSRQVMRSIEQADEVSDQDNLERLKQLAAQQNQISTAESIEQVNSLVSKVLGTGPRASAPAKEPIGGEFETDSAQLHDVRREMLEDGTFKYIAILVDSAGRTQEAEMPAAEGESAYKTFELIKQNPLLERVYRGVVMSLLDKIIKPNP